MAFFFMIFGLFIVLGGLGVASVALLGSLLISAVVLAAWGIGRLVFRLG